MSQQSLTDKTVKGVGWNSVDRIANYGIGFIVGIVLARLLSPEEYGLIGIIGIFTAIFNIILDSGLSTALIRKHGVTDADYCTVFWTNLILSFALTAILLIMVEKSLEELHSIIQLLAVPASHESIADVVVTSVVIRLLGRIHVGQLIV